MSSTKIVQQVRTLLVGQYFLLPSLKNLNIALTINKLLVYSTREESIVTTHQTELSHLLTDLESKNMATTNKAVANDSTREFCCKKEFDLV